MKSYWFKRLQNDIENMSPHLRMKRIKLGFWRIYYKDAYIGEVFEEMAQHGYDINDVDPRLKSFRYYEEFEDNAELTRKIKNYVEGYWDSLKTLRKRLYLMRNHKEFYKNAKMAYRQVMIK